MVSYTVSVRNNDGSACSASNFNLVAAFPSGWSALIGSQNLSIGAGASSATSLQVTSTSSAADGFYGIGVSATNTSLPQFYASGGAVYSLVSSMGAAVASNKSSYTRTQTVTVNATFVAAGSPVAGAPVTFSFAKPNGITVLSNAVTGSNGVAVFTHALNKKKDPPGTYQVRASATLNGVSGNGSVSFDVR
jgi:hypothetical protein